MATQPGHSQGDSHAHHEGHSHNEHSHAHAEGGHEQDHGGHEAHGHAHGTIDPSIIASERGIWAIKWSFVGLMVTTLIQVVIFYFSNSIALG